MKININDIYDQELRDDFYVLAKRYLISQDIDPDIVDIDININYRDEHISCLNKIHKVIVNIGITYKQKQDIKSLSLNKEFKE